MKEPKWQILARNSRSLTFHFGENQSYQATARVIDKSRSNFQAAKYEVIMGYIFRMKPLVGRMNDVVTPFDSLPF